MNLGNVGNDKRTELENNSTLVHTAKDLGYYIYGKEPAVIQPRSISRHSVASKQRTVKMKTLLESTS